VGAVETRWRRVFNRFAGVAADVRGLSLDCHTSVSAGTPDRRDPSAWHLEGVAPLTVSRCLLLCGVRIALPQECLDQLRFLVVGIDAELANCKRQTEFFELPFIYAAQLKLDARGLADVPYPPVASHR